MRGGRQRIVDMGMRPNIYSYNLSKLKLLCKKKYTARKTKRLIIRYI